MQLAKIFFLCSLLLLCVYCPIAKADLIYDSGDTQPKYAGSGWWERARYTLPDSWGAWAQENFPNYDHVWCELYEARGTHYGVKCFGNPKQVQVQVVAAPAEVKNPCNDLLTAMGNAKSEETIKIILETFKKMGCDEKRLPAQP